MLEIFDTQHIYRNLAGKGGFSEAQAEALTDVLRNVVSHNIDNLATKDDLTRLESEFRSEMKIMQQQLTIRLGGIMIAAITFAALQVFRPSVTAATFDRVTPRHNTLIQEAENAICDFLIDISFRV